MAETVTSLQTRAAADHRLLLKLYHRYLRETAEPVYESVPEPENWKLTLILALAPMVVAFFYLLVMSCFLFL